MGWLVWATKIQSCSWNASLSRKVSSVSFTFVSVGLIYGVCCLELYELCSWTSLVEVKYITARLLRGGGRATLITPIWLCFVINVTDNLFIKNA